MQAFIFFKNYDTSHNVKAASTVYAAVPFSNISAQSAKRKAIIAGCLPEISCEIFTFYFKQEDINKGEKHLPKCCDLTPVSN